jgi:hypothetical protein
LNRKEEKGITTNKEESGLAEWAVILLDRVAALG